MSINRSIRRYVQGLILLLAFNNMPAFAQQAESVTVQPAAVALASLIANLNSYQADFEQRVRNEEGTEIDFSSGTFAIQRPNLFRWEIKQQFSQVIVADGTSLWTYDRDLEQVTIQNQSKLLSESPLLMLTSTAEELSAAFVIKQLPIEDSTNKKLFLMQPAAKESVFDSVHILFVDGILAELLMADTLGQQTTVEFSNAQLNVKLDQQLFSFEVPEGIDIVDSRAKVQPED